MTGLLAIDDVSVHFGGTKAVDQVSLALEPGTLYGIIGPNGSGKSTLLGALSRLTRLTAGSMHFDGTDYTRLSPQATARLGIRRTFQTVRLMPLMTVLDNVALGADAGLFGQSILRSWLALRTTRRLDRESRSIAQAALERVGIGHLGGMFPGSLSYGTQRKVEIARALAANPTLLLLDEPTAGMTRRERDEIGDLLVELRDGGLTQILVEHDVPLITRVCGHLFVLNTGQLIAAGDPRTVVLEPAVQEAYLGRKSQ
jgi:branched-chain amino acid transport system ATP-binding protein